jgi:putative ABC transport system ATP-binding protein
MARATPPSTRCAASRSTSRPARSPRSWGRPGRASRRSCTCSPASTSPPSTVDIDGTEIGKLDDGDLTRLRRDKIGFVFQAFNLVPVLTAEENIRLPLTLAGRDDAGGRVARLLEAVALTDRKTHRPAELSGGQQQRVAVARALASEPAVIFADEPTGNLDSTTSAEILGLLRRAVDEFGQAVVMVTHEATAAAIADRVIFLDDGAVVADDSGLDAEQILDRMKALA